MSHNNRKKNEKVVLTMNTTQLLLQTKVHDSKCISIRKERSFRGLNHTWVDKNIRSVTECLVASEKIYYTYRPTEYKFVTHKDGVEKAHADLNDRIYS